MTAAIASGDPDAFARFYEEWFDRMYAIARSTTRLDEHTCLDIVQDAMMRVIRSCKPIENEPALRAWVGRVVRSAAIDHLRAERRRRERETAVSKRTEQTATVTEIDDRIAWIRKELESMGPEQSGLLALRFARGLGLKEIGAMLGVGAGAAHGRIERALKAMRRQSGEPIDD